MGWHKSGRADLVAGEAQLAAYARAATRSGEVAALVGWTPESEREALVKRVAEFGGSVARLRLPRGVDPPTLLPERAATRPFTALVRTYATVPYRDVDPRLLSGLAYVLMFGMMFADAGQGALLVLLAVVLLRAGRPRRLASLSPVWPLVAGAGVFSAMFGVLYGECFGPTGIMPVVWLAPLDSPVSLLVAGVGVGGVLLAGAYALGVVNRWREGGPELALYAPSGIAGAGLFLALGVMALAVYMGSTSLVSVAALIGAAAVALTFTGFYAASGGGPSGAGQAGVEVFDLVIRLGSNLMSFARLAAFGFTHAALGLVVWSGTVALWGRGVVGAGLAVVLFVAGNAVTFALEGVVVAIQALRLEYYELFSRVFLAEGRPFRPWRVPVDPETSGYLPAGGTTA